MVRARHPLYLYFMFVLVLISLTVIPVANADTVTGFTFSGLATNGSLIFDWQHNVNVSGNWSDSHSLSLILSSPSLPTGSTITGASLQLVLDPGGPVEVNPSGVKRTTSMSATRLPSTNGCVFSMECSDAFPAATSLLVTTMFTRPDTAEPLISLERMEAH